MSAPRTAVKDSVRSAPDHPTAILTIICVSYFMVILDNSIIFTGLPSIESAMAFTPIGLTWVQDAYTLVFGGLLLLGARAGDIVGRRRMFIIGLVLFGLASLLVGLAPYAWWLIAARALQGIGAAILAPSSLALLTASFPEGTGRARAVAAYSAVAGIGASAGLVVGGALADLLSWRAGFFLNVPIGLAMLLAARRYLAVPERTAGGRFDLVGALTATLGMTGLVFAVVESSVSGWTSPLTIAPLAVGVALLVGLVINEAHAEQPIMPLRLFASRTRVGAYLVRMLYLGAMMGFFFFTTQYLQGILGFTPLEAGLAFLPMSAVNFAVALLVNRVLERVGANTTLVLGVATTLIGMGWLGQVSASSAYLTAVALPMVLIGVGQGLAFAPLTSAGLAGAPPEDAGAASGLVNTFHQVGSSLGLAVLVAIGASAVPAGDTTPDQDLLDRVGVAISGGAIMLAIALVVTLAIVARRAPCAPKVRRERDQSSEVQSAPVAP